MVAVENEESSEVGGGHPKVDKRFRVTIEPGLFVILFGMMTAYIVMQILALDKACRVNAGYSGKMGLVKGGANGGPALQIFETTKTCFEQTHNQGLQ